MMASPLASALVPMPKNERSRIEELRDYAILDTPQEADFDDVVNLAKTSFASDAALISLVDSRRQWFKARVGLEVSETPRSSSFCAHTILTDDPMVVLDATRDARFADNPLVTGPPHIRFYAGAPIRTHAGFNIGALCVIDSAPRLSFSDADKRQLTALSSVVADRLFLRREADRRQRKRYRTDLAGMIKAYRHPTVEVRVYDISEGGAMLKCEQTPPARGEEVTLLIAGSNLVATVAWQQGDICGVSFHRNLARSQIEAIRQA